MASGRVFSDRERVYIDTWAYKKSWGQIARELGELYEEDNGGSRTSRGVQSYVKTREHEARRPSQKVLVPIDSQVMLLAKAKGYTKKDISFLLKAVLVEINN